MPSEVIAPSGGGSGGSGTPGGADTQVQYNDGGAFGGEAGFSYDKTANEVTVPGITVAEDFGLTGVISPTPSADQDDYSPSGFATASIVRLNPSASINISGFAAGKNGEIKTLFNVATDYIVLLTHEDPSSTTAGNRFNFGQALPFYALLPGEGCTFWYDNTSSRWRFLYGHHQATLMSQFSEWTDFTGGNTSPVLDGPYDRLFSESNGAAASSQAIPSTAGTFSVGLAELDTGTSAGGRTYLCSPPGISIAPAKSGVLIAARLWIPSASNGTQRFQIRFGLHDGAQGTDVVDGVYWEYDDSVSADWRTACAAGSLATKTTVTGWTVSTTFITLGIWINPDWTRADFFHIANNSVAVVVSADGTQSGVRMPSQSQLVDISIGINKTIGSTSKSMVIDWMGWRWSNLQRLS